MNKYTMILFPEYFSTDRNPPELQESSIFIRKLLVKS